MSRLYLRIGAYHATCLITGIRTLANVCHVLLHSITTLKQDDVFVQVTDRILWIMNVSHVDYQIIGMKLLETVIDVLKLFSMILTNAAVSALYFIHFCKVVNVPLAHIQIIGIWKPIHARIVQIHTFMIQKVRNALALKALPLNSMENAFPATILITGMKLPECVSHAQKLTNSAREWKDANAHKSYHMTLVSSVSHVSSPNTGIKIQRHVNNAHLIRIIHKVQWDASLVLLLHQSGTANNAWAVHQEPFSIPQQKLVRAVLRDLCSSHRPQDVFVLRILTWLDRNVWAAILQISGMNKRRLVFHVHRLSNMITIRRNVSVLQTDRINRLHWNNASLVRHQDIGTKYTPNACYVRLHIFSVKRNRLAFALNRLLLKRIKSVCHAIIQTFGIMIRENVRLALRHMFMIRREEDAFALQVSLSIQVLNVCNV